MLNVQTVTKELKHFLLKKELLKNGIIVTKIFILHIPLLTYYTPYFSFQRGFLIPNFTKTE